MEDGTFITIENQIQPIWQPIRSEHNLEFGFFQERFKPFLLLSGVESYLDKLGTEIAEHSTQVEVIGATKDGIGIAWSLSAF